MFTEGDQKNLTLTLRLYLGYTKTVYLVHCVILLNHFINIEHKMCLYRVL